MQEVPQCALFQGMSPAEFKSVMDCAAPVTREYKKDAVILSQGEEATSIGVVLAGKVSVAKLTADGAEVLLAIIKPGGTFAETVALLPSGRVPATVTALTDCRVMFLNAAHILHNCEKLCAAHTKLTANTMAMLAAKTHNLNQRLSYLIIRSLRGRIVALLTDLSGGRMAFSIGMSRAQMAETLNASRPSLSRELSRMKDEGLIDYDGDRFKLLKAF